MKLMQHFCQYAANSECKNKDETHAAFLPMCSKIQKVKTKMKLMQHFCQYETNSKC